MSAPRILVPLAAGFEEIEAIVPVDVWRRAGFAVTTAALADNPVTASRQTKHVADALLPEVLDLPYDLIFLPGGRPGADNLAACQPLLRRLVRQRDENLRLAAICAAPLALNAAGLLAGKKFTCHPTAAADLADVKPVAERVVLDSQLLTAVAAGAAFDLALAVVAWFAGDEAVAAVDKGLLYR